MIWAFLSATQAGWLAALPNVVLCSELFLCCSCCWELQAIAPGAIPYKPLCSKWNFRWSRSYMKELDHHRLETTHLCMCFMCASMYRHMLLGPALASYPVRDHSYVMQNPACHWAQLRQILLYSSNTKLGHNLYAWLWFLLIALHALMFLNANTELIIPTRICMYNTTHNHIGLIVHSHSEDRKKLYYRKGLAQDNGI